MKTIYFLRHGQTALNRTFTHQYGQTPLSQNGMHQAHGAAAHFKTVPLDVILASDLRRAKQTADIVAAEKGMQVEENNLFEELRRPSALWGRSWFAPTSVWTMGLLYLLAGRPGWHYSDEENLDEFHTRAKAALEYLAHRPEEHILVVSHRGLLVTMMERMKMDGMDTINQYRLALWKNFTIGNGCWFSATWSPEGENGETLTGTWTLESGVECPNP
jgi:broad specificity phosphatase PhoE